MKRYQRMMVALAQTDSDSELIAYAALLADRIVPQVVDFVHVVPDEETQSGSAESRAAIPDTVAVKMQEHVATAFGAHDRVKTQCHVLHGALVDRLLEFAADQQTELVLVGHRKTRSGRRALARRLATKAPCSIWMVPEGSPVAFERILIPIDFSERSADALDVATTLANLSGHEECVAIHVYERAGIMSYEDYDEEILRAQQGREFSRFISSIDCNGVRVVPVFREGENVSEKIREVAGEQKADLIIMATRGRTRAASILLGSEAEQTIMETTVPILAVKHFGERLSLLQVLLDRNFGRVPVSRFE